MVGTQLVSVSSLTFPQGFICIYDIGVIINILQRPEPAKAQQPERGYS